MRKKIETLTALAPLSLMSLSEWQGEGLGDEGKREKPPGNQFSVTESLQSQTGMESDAPTRRTYED